MALTCTERGQEVAQTRTRTTLTLLGLTALACTTDTPPTSTPVIRDSAGVHIVENRNTAPGLAWHLSAEPVVEIGGEDAGEDYELFQVWSTVRLSDARIVVANGGSHELRFYAADGTFVRSIGRRGDGPGEFQNLRWMQRMAGDSLITYDFRQLRLSVFDSSGAFARSFRFQTTDDVPFASIIDRYADGSFLAQGFANTGGSEPTGLQRHDAPLYHFAADGTFLTTLGMFPGKETYYKPLQGGGFSFFEAFFPRMTFRRAAGTHLYIAPNDSYEIRRHTMDGALTGLVRRTHSSTAVTDTHARLERERRLAQASNQHRPTLSEVLDEMPVPETFPAYGSVRVDDELNLWVQEYPIPGLTQATWSVFDPSGVLVGEVKVPQGLDPKHIGKDFILGIWRDELGVEHVRLYELVKP